MLLIHRNPSVNWEPVPIEVRIRWPGFGSDPTAVPTGMMLVISAALFVDPSLVVGLSLRRLVAFTGLDPSQILCWTINGMNFRRMRRNVASCWIRHCRFLPRSRI